MSTTSIRLGSPEGAQSSSQVVLDLAQYTLQQVQQCAEFVLFRGFHKGLGDAGRSSILVRAPAADAPASACLRRLQEEYDLRSELDPAFVVRPLALVQAQRRPVLVLEDPGGLPLDLFLHDPMEMRHFLLLAVSVAAALGHVHSRGLIHKDVKPANILVNATRDRAWLMGLGAASRLRRERQPSQPSEFAAGTLAYTSPEQTGRMNRSIDSRSDLYSLGVTFYQMLTASLPFTASDPMEWVHCHIARKPVPPNDRSANVPAPISQIIMKLLAKTAEERYQTAAGLESDLRRCLAEWETQHRIDEFPLGEHDTPDRLLIPEKLYGRESEIDALLTAFDRVVAGGKPELVLVCGYAGIGKSSVVNELHKFLVQPRGLFASGKFDQYKRDIPYATLAQAFQSLVRLLLGKSEDELSKWRDALHDALGPNGRLIVNLVPELQLIIGEPPPVPDLAPQDAQRRFQLALRRFIGVFTSAEHPLVLFLDDLQWLDSATLDLIEDLLTQSDVWHLMLIGAYRDNEVDSFHPLRAKLDKIRTAGAAVQEIVLGSLTCQALTGLITDSFHREAQCATALAGLVHEKTAGNPFFASQFIAALVEEGLITFDHAARRWSWDLEHIRGKGYTDNVADLMVGKLSQLPVETQQALQLLACMGNSVEFTLLERVSQQSNEALQGQLWQAIRAGLIFRTKHSYRFLHDRVQEAAYSLIPQNERAETHLRIGRLLAAHLPPEQRHESIYEIVNQLNRGAPLITSEQEREQLAQLNLIAGKRAKAATAYGSALKYLTIGACGVAVFPWGRHVRVALPLIRRGWEAALQTGDRTYTAYACCHLVQNRLTSADPVEEVQREAESALKFAQKTRFALAVDVVMGQLGFIKTLRGLTPQFGSFRDDAFDEGRFEQHFEESPSLIWPACLYWLRKLQARFYAGDYGQAVAAAAKARTLLDAMNGVFEEADYHFYAALARAAVSDSATADERREHSGALAEHHRRLALWEENCSENFANRVALVGAEIARLAGRELEAERLYEHAIRTAREQGFVQNEGLAYELAARFHAARGFEEFADLYLRRARHCYQRWGADGKVRQLTELYPRLRENEPALDSHGTSGVPVEQLELATVLKVSQAVSGEMILDRLLDRLMRTAIEHAGAERGLLIAPRGDELQIQALATASGPDVTVHVRDSDHTEAALPQSLVRFVMRTRDTVILEDASSENLFSADPYLVQHRARSVLCLPLINQGNLIGALYLENNLAPRVFGPARIAVLKLLASQAAMALENTRLYGDLAKREAKIQRLVDANVVGIDIWDLDGSILEANDEFLRIVGYEREDLVSGRLRWTDLTPAQCFGLDRQEVFAEIARTGSVQPLEWEFFHKDGRRIPVLAGGASFEGTQGIGFILDLTERKRVEQALRQSEAYLAEAQRLSHTGSWAYDHLLGRVKYYSDEAFRLFGLDPRRSSGPPQLEESLQLIHPEDRERVREELGQIVRDNAEYEQQYRIVLPDGTVRHMHSNGLPILNQAGELLEYIGTVRDVTERKCAEQRLLAQHRVARILAEAATVEEATPKILQAVCECMGWHVGALWRIDREAGVLRCAELWQTPSLEAAQFAAVTRTCTFSPGSGLPGRVWASGAPAYIPDVIRDPNFPRAGIAALEGLQGGLAFPILLGHEVLGVIEFFSRDVLRPEQNLLDMLATIGSQVGQFTKRAAAVDELQLRVSMLQHIPVAAWSVMPDGTPDIVNELWFEYTGQTPEYVNSHPEAWMATLHPEDRERAAGIYWDGIRSGRGFTMEARLLRARDGTYRWHLNRAVAVRDLDGNIVRFVGTSTDVHDWRQAQEELRNMQAELAHTTRVLTMGELTASIAHEVNQPLGAIVTSAGACERWLAANPPQMEKARRALERIVNDGRRAGEVIKRIRALMKRQTLQKEWLQINDAILEVIAIAQHQLRRNDILLETSLAEGLPLVRGDRVQLQQVLLNLIVNAIEAMSGIGERRRELTIVSVADGPEAVVVEVRDSGMGLDPEHAAHLFESFYTTKPEGLGIGLSISRTIVEAHGGHLSAAANLPHGAVFRLTVPLEEPVS